MERGGNGRSTVTIVLAVLVLLVLLVLLAGVVGWQRGRGASPASQPASVIPPLSGTIGGGTVRQPALAPDGSVLRFGATGSSTCTNPATDQEWRVRWQVADSAGAATEAGRAGVTASGFDVRIGTGARLAQDDQTWALRWTPTLHEALTATGGETFDRRGTVAQLNQTAVRVDQAPRYVTPDGACTVYVIPFGTGSPAQGGKPARSVAVIGDSLTAQLSAPDGDALVGTGALQARFRDDRLGIDGQAGRLWTATPDPYPALDVANGTMLDELRGYAGADVRVIALGANDAGYVALAPEGQRETRLAWVLLHLAPILDELNASGRCTVLLTVADRKTRYADSPESDYAEAAGKINDLIRQRVARSPGSGGKLRLSDWAEAAAGHHGTGPDSWFGPDTLHLNTPGRTAYADQIAAAADLC